jgi:hypothetical protein
VAVGAASSEDETYLAEGVEYLVKVDQDFPLGHLGDVVHGLARIVANPRILVAEAGENRRNDDLEVSGQVLHTVGGK